MTQPEKPRKNRWTSIQAALTVLFFGLGIWALYAIERRDLVAVCLLAVSVLKICDLGVTIRGLWKSRDKDLRIRLGWRIAGEIAWILILIMSAQTFLGLDRILRTLP